MEILLKQLNFRPISDFENLKATASCVLIKSDQWVLIKGFCVWEKKGKLSVSNPPKFGGYGNPFNGYISMSVSLKEKIHGLIKTAYGNKKLGKGLEKFKISKPVWSPEEWNIKAAPGRTNSKDAYSLKVVLEDGEDRIQFKGLGIGKKGVGFLKAGIVTPARERFVFSPSIRFTFTVGSLGVFIKS